MKIQNAETMLLEAVCPAIIDKHDFELVQITKEKQLKELYPKAHLCLYAKNNPMFKCNCFNTRINVKKIE